MDRPLAVPRGLSQQRGWMETSLVRFFYCRGGRPESLFHGQDKKGSHPQISSHPPHLIGGGRSDPWTVDVLLTDNRKGVQI
ncbi:hypothetical protein CEXT_494311 [Caerostris extrusa]|uniref:Uncharacterized protein n=1 Tax=Caerostris extrusa TaxID=172846 RepID=A0AAV4YFQ1_CAEEX|nr:hypothetical protein CEXT_494311 [Caerostris extrusa]